MKTAISVKELNVPNYGSEALENSSFTVEEGKLVSVIEADSNQFSLLTKVEVKK